MKQDEQVTALLGVVEQLTELVKVLTEMKKPEPCRLNHYPTYPVYPVYPTYPVYPVYPTYPYQGGWWSSTVTAVNNTSGLAVTST